MKMSIEHWWNNSDRGKQKYREKHLSQCRYITRTDLGSNPILRGERPTTELFIDCAVPTVDTRNTVLPYKHCSKLLLLLEGA
jgi:hypothetical protein